MGYAMVMFEDGVKAGNEIVREILAMRDNDGKPLVSKYKMARDLNVEDATVYNWAKGLSSPSMQNYLELKQYRLWAERLSKFPLRYRRSA